MASNGSPSRGHGGGHQYPATMNHGKLHQGDHYGDVHNYYGAAGGPQRAVQEKVDACRNALFLTDPIIDRETLKSTKGERTAGTCEWIKDNGIYKSWVEGSPQCLWISGGPGKGKTMLSNFLVEELETRTRGTKDAVLFYFCSNQDEKRNSAVAVLRGLAYQLVRERRELPKDILSAFESPERTQTTLSSAEALWIMFRKLLEAPDLGKVFCVLDGLDECDDTSTRLLVDKICQYFSPQSSKANGGLLKLVIVSRNIARLDALPQVKLDPDNDDYVSGNIKVFISAKVQELERVQGFDSVRKTVEDALLSRADGTFLWVGFVVGELLKKNTCEEIKQTLYSFPRALNAIYNRMLRQIDRSRQDTAFRILRWVTMAVRPLTLQELTTAIFPSTTHVSDQAIRDHITLCGPILEIHNQQVHLVHQSAKDYLLPETPNDDPIKEKFRIRVEEAHAELARTCLHYIEHSDLRNKYLNLYDASVQRQWPLLNYATLHWQEHARQSSTHSDNGVDLKRPFFQRTSIVRMNWWLTYHTKNRMASWSDQYAYGLPLLHTASFLGIESLVRKLLLKTVWDLMRLRKSVDKKDKYGRTALSLAALGGHEGIVQLLLEKGADINKKDKHGITALSLAALGGHKVVVQLLLEKGADINKKDKYSRTELSLATLGGHEVVVQLLLGKGVDIMKDHYGFKALYGAAQEGHEAIAQLLLKKGADINARDDSGRTALIGAAYGGHEVIVKLLLEKGAAINQKDELGMTALSVAAREGHETIVQLLLEKGAH